ncbi:MAG: hypothetical protein AMXMBFR13_49200 [Phycisphaerae bacterium]
MNPVWLLVLIISLVVMGGFIEAVVHRRNLTRIPIRIHVNGTRGKSSVTRLIAAGLRAGGITTCAKTTGALPRMILPDGSEYPVFRPAGANVIEQVRIVSTAASYGAQALVLECMALTPHLQTLSAFKLVRSTHGVITNVREDHLEIMGPTEEDVALAMAGMTPVRGKLFTAERRHLEVLQAAARDRGSELITVGAEEVARMTSAEMARFRYVEHPENVALALRICEHLGIDREVALRGMWKAQPDAGAMTLHEIRLFGDRRFYFVNGFAANDPESTQRIWNMALERFSDVDKHIAIFNCRSDRPERSQQLGAACVHWRPADHYVLIGSGTYLFARAALKSGLDFSRIVIAEHNPVHEVFEKVVALAGDSAVIMGMGNIGGPGLDLVQFFRNRSMARDVA